MPKSLPDELYHYTGIYGLKGIVESQTLWATHYKYLNDAEEITHFRVKLPEVLRPVFENMFSGLNPQQKQLLVKEYGSIDIALREEPKNLAATVYNTTFGGSGDEPFFAEPYITAFCTVDKANERIANHGLLSQWRAYGAQGGYVIIFDTERLIQLLQEEGKQWAYAAVFAGDVVYSSPTDEEMRDEFCTQIDVIQKNWEEAFRTHDSTDLKDTYKHFVSCACRYKHWGFAEEREFRIVIVPTPSHIIEIAKAVGKTILAKKPVSSFLRNGTAVPYLNLFEGITGLADKRLPIKRVIVGPHPDKDKRKIAVEKLLSQNNIQADVSVTAIPYLG
jgi:hypothetical protein